MRFNELLTTWPTVSERRDSKVPKSKNILLPSSCTDGFSSFRPFLAYRSLGTVGFRDVTETNGREKFIAMTSPRSILELLSGSK